MTAAAVVANLAGMMAAKRASTKTMDDGVVERAREIHIGERVTPGFGEGPWSDRHAREVSRLPGGVKSSPS